MSICSQWVQRASLVVLTFAILCSSVGCVEHALSQKMLEEPDVMPVRSQIEPTEGAIWRGDSTSGSFLYYDRKARGLGDLVTVVLVDNLSAVGSANTSTGKQSSISANLSSDVGLGALTAGIAGFVMRMFGMSSGVGETPGQSLNFLESSTSNDFEGDGETTRESSFKGVVTCQVIEEFPGGLLRIRGKRELVINHEMQMITVSGLVRRADISIDNSVHSTQLADAKIAFDGLGVIDDKQRPGLIARVVDWAYPF